MFKYLTSTTAAILLLATASPGLARNVAADKAAIGAGLDKGYARLDAL